jgi:hypothetical protein
MAFEGRQMMLAGLIEFVLPSGSIRLSEGGYVKLAGHKFRAQDPEWGSLGEVEPIEEAADEQAPGMVITFIPVSAAAGAALAADENVLAPVRLWLTRVDRATGEGDPNATELLGDLLMDDPELLFGGERVLRLSLISAADRLMTINKGNVLSSSFHQSVWPGELGLDNAVDVDGKVAWRVSSPPRGSVGSGGGGGLFGLFSQATQEQLA